MVLPVLDNRTSNAAPATSGGVTIWLGTESTSYTTANNWSLRVPVNGDRVFFTDSTRDVADTFQNSVVLEEFRVGPNYGGKIGEGGISPGLVINAKTMVFGSAKCSISMIPKVQDLHILAMPRQCFLGNGTLIKRLFIHTTTGVLLFTGAAATRDVFVAPGSSTVKMPDSQVGVSDGGTVFGPKVRIGRGNRLVSACDLRDARISGTLEHIKGTVLSPQTFGKESQIISSGPSIQSMEMFGGSLVVADEPSDTTLGTNLGTFATLDLSGHLSNARLITDKSNRRITHSKGGLIVEGDNSIRLASGQTVTLT